MGDEENNMKKEKNNIIHKLIYKNWENGTYRGFFYLCNQAVGATMYKCSYWWKKVNCKNCLKQKHEKRKK